MNASRVVSRSFSLRTSFTGLLIAALALMSLTTATPGQCASGPEIVAQFGGGGIKDTKTLGDLAYVAMGDAGLVVLDLSDEQHIREIGSLRFPGTISKVDARPGVAFVVEGVQDTIIHAIDITTPVRPRLLGSLTLGSGYPKTIKLRGDVLYATTSDDGLKIIDTTDPAAMSVISTVPISGAVDFGVSGGLCVLVTSTHQYVIDVSNPNAPAIVSTTASGGLGVSLSGQTAFVSRQQSENTFSINAIDLTLPSQPALLSTFDGGSTLTGANGVLYSLRTIRDDAEDWCNSVYGASISAFDVNNPSNPVEVASVFSVLYGKGLEPLQNRLLLRANNEMSILESPALGFAPVSYFVPRIGSLRISDQNSSHMAEITSGSASHFRLQRRFDLNRLDVSDPTHPVREFSGWFDQSVNSDSTGESWSIDAISGDQLILTGHKLIYYNCEPDYYGQLGILSPAPDGSLVLEVLESDYLINFTGVSVSKQTLYATYDWPHTLLIYHLSDTGSPVLQSQTQLAGIPRGLTVDGQYLYVNIDPNTIQVLDVSDPVNPVVVDSSVLPVSPLRSPHVMSDGRLIARLPTGIAVFDTRTPGQITQTGGIDFGDVHPWGLRGIFDIDDDTVLVWSADTFWIVNVSKRQNPVIEDTVFFELSQQQGYGRFVGVIEGMPYARIDGAISILDINGETTLTQTASASTVDTTFATTVSGNLAFVSDYTGGLRIFDVADPTNSFEVGAYDTPDRAYETIVIGNLAYVADGATGLMVLDVSDPASPTLVSSLALSDLAIGLAVDGDFAYIATRFDGLQILDITNPASPVLVGSVDTPGSAQRVTLDGNLVYVADGTGGVQIIDVTARSSPNIVGSYNTPSSARQVLVRGLVAYVPDRTTGLIALDISDPTNPQLISTLPGLGDTRGVTAWGHLAFVADFAGFVHMVDIADPGDMQLIQTVASLGTPRAVSNDGRMLYLADGDAGLTILDAQPCWYNPCPADLIEDGLLDFFDIQAYLNAYSAGDGLADWNDDGQIDFFDLQRYLIDYSAGCP